MLALLLTGCLYLSEGEVTSRLGHGRPGDDSGDPTPRCDVDHDGERSLACDGTDCDDEDEAVNTTAPEACNGRDDNCDGAVDEDGGAGEPVWYLDVDQDGYGDPASGVATCTEPTGQTSDGTDCDDTNIAVNPGATEACNGVDDNCDDEVDEAGAASETPWHPDGDRDGHGDPSGRTVDACSQPDGYAAAADDCDDADSAVYPGAPERCDGLDNDCGGTIDDGDAACPCSLTHSSDGHAYQHCVAKKSWTDAESSCAANGYSLATVTSEIEARQVTTTADTVDMTANWWIGLNDRATEGTYAWDDGSPFSFALWADGEPANADGATDCVGMETGVDSVNRWAVFDCATQGDYVCEAE